MALNKKPRNWIEQTNPLRALTAARIVYLLEALDRGELADVQWAFQKIEESDPDMVALIARTLAPLTAMDFDVKQCDDEDLSALAEQQAAQLKRAYGQLENLREAIAHLALAKYRGFAICQCQDAAGTPCAPGVATQLACLDQWNFARDGRTGAFKWNPEGQTTNFDSLPEANLLDPKRDFLIIRECARPVDRIALVKFVRSNFTQKAWADFIETAARQGVAIVEPNGLGNDPDAAAKFREAAEAYSEGNTVSLPNGSTITFANASRGQLPFESHMRFLREQLVLAGTGGMLTMLSQPTGIGGGASVEHDKAFQQITAGEAMEISECFQKHFDKAVLAGAKPVAYFALAAREETNPSAVLADAKLAKDAGLQVNPEEISEKSGYELTAAAPVAPPAPFGSVVGRVTDPAQPATATAMNMNFKHDRKGLFASGPGGGMEEVSGADGQKQQVPRLRETKVPTPTQTFQKLGVKPGNVYANYDKLQQKHPEYFATTREAREHVEFVMQKPDHVVPGNETDHKLLVRTDLAGHRTVALEIELRGGKYRVQSAFIMDADQLEVKRAINSAGPGATGADSVNSQPFRENSISCWAVLADGLPAELTARYGESIAKAVAVNSSPEDALPPIVNHPSAIGNSSSAVSAAVAATLQIRAEWIAPFFQALEKKAADGKLTDAELLAAVEAMAKALPELMADRPAQQIADLVTGLLTSAAIRGVASSVEHTEVQA